MTCRFHITGLVQGVGFRYFVHRRASGLGLLGWVRNLPDGRVEVVASGTPEGILNLETALRQGPPMARVQQVEKFDISDEVASVKSFEIR
jgi:acylphosphatase